MDTNEKKFPEQQAPEKNTDDAFVQVGKDGHPVIAKKGDDDNENKSETEKAIEQPVRK